MSYIQDIKFRANRIILMQKIYNHDKKEIIVVNIMNLKKVCQEYL
jgi:hypothetical protein